MTSQLGKWGNSLAIRIPGAYAKDLGLCEGMEVEITVVGDGLLLKHAEKTRSLDELVAEIAPENLHGETEWGSATGREIW